MEKEQINFLVRRLKRGDKDAFEELFRGLYRPLYLFIYNLIYDKRSTEDILHNVFIELIKKPANKIYYYNCFGWIFTVAKRQAFNHNKKHRREIPIDAMESFSGFKNFDNIDEELLMIRIVIERLPKIEKILILLRYQEEFTYKMLADAMNTSETSMKRKIKKILEKIEKTVKGI